MPFISPRSMTRPSSQVPSPAKLWPPPRTAMGRSWSTPKRTAADHVGDAGGTSDQCRRAVDAGVPDLPDFVVVRVGRRENRTPHRRPEVIDMDSVGWCGGEGSSSWSWPHHAPSRLDVHLTSTERQAAGCVVRLCRDQLLDLIDADRAPGRPTPRRSRREPTDDRSRSQRDSISRCSETGSRYARSSAQARPRRRCIQSPASRNRVCSCDLRETHRVPMPLQARGRGVGRVRQLRSGPARRVRVHRSPALRRPSC